MSCVVGADTSTQHIAALAGIPSIACYPADSGYMYYYWGHASPISLCFRVPAARQSRLSAGLAHLIAVLAMDLMESGTGRPPDRARNRQDLGQGLREFSAACRAGALRQESCRKVRAHLCGALRSLEAGLRAAWRPHILPELRQVASEICARMAAAPSHIDEIALSRIPRINAVQILSRLAGHHMGGAGRRGGDSVPGLRAEDEHAQRSGLGRAQF